MLKIRLLDFAGQHVSDAEIDWNPDEMGEAAPDVVAGGLQIYVLERAAAFDREKVAAVYRSATSRRLERIVACKPDAATSIETTRTGARMTLPDGETSADDAQRLADAARGR